MTVLQMKAKPKVKARNGWDASLHGYDRPRTKTEERALPYDERQRIKRNREVDRALLTLAEHNILQWDKDDP